MTNCLVLGGASNVFDDVEKAIRLGEFDNVITCNDVTVEWKGPILAAVSLHSDKWPLWLKRRKLNDLPIPERVFGHLHSKKTNKTEVNNVITDYINHLWPGQIDSGSSGLFAVKVALDEFSFDRVVACGIPMTAEGRHYFNARPWGGAASHRRGWKQAKALGHLENVRSISGWTAELCGKPTVEWLLEGKS